MPPQVSMASTTNHGTIGCTGVMLQPYLGPTFMQCTHGYNRYTPSTSLTSAISSMMAAIRVLSTSRLKSDIWVHLQDTKRAQRLDEGAAPMESRTHPR